MKQMYDIETVIKIVIVGDSGVGKTNLLHRYTDKKFLENTKGTLGVDFHSMTKTMGKSLVKIQFWDTAGQENYHAIVTNYYKQVTKFLDLVSLKLFKYSVIIKYKIIIKNSNQI